MTASDWFRFEVSLRRSPKIRRLAERLGIQRVHALGHVAALWCWVMPQSIDGVLDGYAPDDLAEAADWEGDPEVFVSALLDSGLLEETETGWALVEWLHRVENFKAAKRTKTPEQKEADRVGAKRRRDQKKSAEGQTQLPLRASNSVAQTSKTSHADVETASHASNSVAQASNSVAQTSNSVAQTSKTASHASHAREEKRGEDLIRADQIERSSSSARARAQSNQLPGKPSAESFIIAETYDDFFRWAFAEWNRVAAPAGLPAVDERTAGMAFREQNALLHCIPQELEGNFEAMRAWVRDVIAAAASSPWARGEVEHEGSFPWSFAHTFEMPRRTAALLNGQYTQRDRPPERSAAKPARQPLRGGGSELRQLAEVLREEARAGPEIETTARVVETGGRALARRPEAN